MNSISSPELTDQKSPEPMSVRPGYRFVTNIAAADIDRALRAAKIAAPSGEIHLVLIASSDLGLPLKGAALYVRDQMSRLDFFWHLFRSLPATPSLHRTK
jgi:hypothetical protein